MALPAPAVAAPRRALLDLDADLAEAVAPEQRAYARRLLTVPVLQLDRGEWDADEAASGSSSAFAAMILSGLAVRDILIGPVPASELLGPGDIVELRDSGERMLPAAVRFHVAEPASAALLDDRLLVAIRTWPALGGMLIERLAHQEARQAVHRAIAQLPRVDQRVLALLWHLAERWGRVTRVGVTVPLALTHETIGRLVGARRPTVSLALKELAATGAVTRRADGAWLLDGASATALAPAADAQWRHADVAVVHETVPPPPEQRPDTSSLEFERLRRRVRMLADLHSTRHERTLRLLESARMTREAVVRARAQRAAALSRPR